MSGPKCRVRDAPYQQVLLQCIPAEGLLIVSGCSLPEQLVVLQGSCNRVHRKKLADNCLVLHQLQCSVGDLDSDSDKDVPGLQPAAKVADLASVLSLPLPSGKQRRVDPSMGERSLSKGHTYPS